MKLWLYFRAFDFFVSLWLEPFISTERFKYYVHCNSSLIFKSQWDLYILPENLRFEIIKMIAYAPAAHIPAS
jgi:hypothetical protein